MSGISETCGNCGAWKGLHHFETMQCPAGGVEAMVDKPQRWQETTFIPLREKLLKDSAQDLLDAAEKSLETLIGCCVSAGGVDDRKTILETQQMLRKAILKAKGET